VNFRSVTYPEDYLASSPQYFFDALGQFQTQVSQTSLGSVFIYDLIKNSCIGATCSVAKMLGYSADEFHAMGSAGLTHLIHPDDLILVSQYYERFGILKPGEVTVLDYRMLKSDGSWCQLRSH
jgi:PAS fold